MFKEKTMGLIRIQRRTAKRLFEEGKEVFITPHKMRFSEYWKPPYSMAALRSESKFDDIVNSFIYYRCNTETGKYPSFYIKRETLN